MLINNRIYKNILFSLVTALIMILVFIFVVFYDDSMLFSSEDADIINYNSSWTVRGIDRDGRYSSFKDIDLSTPSLNSINMISLEKLLVKDDIDRTILVIDGAYENLRVSVDGKVIFEYGTEEQEGLVKRHYSHVFNKIEILPEYDGKIIKIEPLSLDSISSINSIYFGTPLQVYYNLMQIDWIKLMLFVANFFVGLVIFFLFIITRGFNKNDFKLIFISTYISVTNVLDRLQ